MRSGRGKCPQCKEMIVVDLDAKELRCPFCNALLKKSAKSVAEVRAEEEAKARAAQEAAAAAAAAAMPAPEEVATPETEPAPAEVNEPEVAQPEVTESEVIPSEPVTEAPAEETPEQVDEIGISDDELAMMDETTPEAAEEPAPVEENNGPVDEIGISDEELAMMDEQVPEEAPAEQAPAEEAPAEDSLFSDEPTNEAAPAADDADEPQVFGSIGADEGEQTPEEDAARVADEETDAPAEEEAPVNNNVTLEDDVDPALLDDDLPMIDSAEPETPAEVVAEPEIEPAPADVPPAETDDVAVEDATPTETPVVEAEPIAEVEEPAAKEEAPALEVEDAAPAEAVPAAEAPAEEAPAEESAEEQYVPTEEDMAFAASLSETNRAPARVGFVAPSEQPAEPAKKEKKSKREPKETASKGDNKMRGSSIYKKPVALIMMILSILAAAVWFLYYKVSVFALVSIDLATTIANAMPTFGEEMFGAYVIAAFAGLIAVVSILGLTGKKGKLGFLFVLLADLVFALVTLFGTMPIVEIEALQKIVAEYGEYAVYAIYGLMLIAAVFFAVGLVSGRDEYDLAGGAAILPVIYMAVVIAGYVALILLPKFVDGFSLGDGILQYAILGVIGVGLLMTIVGVHNGSLSRAVNGWFIFAALITIAVTNAVPIVVTKFVPEAALYVHEEIPYFLTPIIAIFGVAGFAAADLRN